MQPSTTVEFLDAIRVKHGLPSDYAARKLLGVSRAAISNYRTGKSLFGDDVALKAAVLLDLDPGYVLACIHAERTKRPQVRDAWEKVARGLAASLAAVFVGVSSPSPSQASPPPSSAAENSTVYIMSKRRRRPKTGQPGDSTGLPRTLSSLAALMGVPKDRTIFA